MSRRYEDRELLSEGGMGEIRRTWDRTLERTVVRKWLLWDHLDDPEMRARFEEEVRITAALLHPGIPTLLDAGVESGRPWLTLREVHGRTLASFLAEGPSDLPTLRRRLAWLAQVADAVAYAHSLGVAHLDLKPDNILIGEFGEVQVIDWGIARRRSEPSGGFGTPGFMAPEQERGEGGPAADVWTLGVLLRSMLPEDAPAELDALARSCRLDAHARPRARAFGETLESWLDGTRNAEEAERLLASARALPEAAAIARRQAAGLTREATAVLAKAPAHAPWSPEKAQAWALEDQAQALVRQAIETEGRLESDALAALALVPGHPEADRLLAAHYRAALERAESEGNAGLAASAEASLRRHDRGEHATWLRGVGALSLDADRPGVVATLHRFELRERRLVPGEPRSLGALPLRDVEIPRGSWLVLLRAPDGVEARYPIHLGRGERWTDPEGRPPRVHIPLQGELGPDEHLVPAGWSRVGGDPGAGDAIPARRVWLEGFAARRHPITNGEYLAFLEDLAGGGASIDLLVPRQGRAGPGELEPPAVWAVEGGRVLQVQPGDGWAADRPVAQVTWHAARTYARWWAARTGLPWRLPHGLEREKMARGADGRRWPWGDHDDPTWSCNLRAHQGVPARAPIGAWPTDESVYGIQGLAGNVRDWCANAWERDPDWPDGGRVDVTRAPEPGAHAEVRGGAWSSEPHFCRPAARFANAPTDRFGSGGFRLVRSP